MKSRLPAIGMWCCLLGVAGLVAWWSFQDRPDGIIYLLITIPWFFPSGFDAWPQGRWMLWVVFALLTIPAAARYFWAVNARGLNAGEAGLFLESMLMSSLLGLCFALRINWISNLRERSPEEQAREIFHVPVPPVISTIVVAVVSVVAFWWWCHDSPLPWSCVVVPLLLCLWSRQPWHFPAVLAAISLIAFTPGILNKDGNSMPGMTQSVLPVRGKVNLVVILQFFSLILQAFIQELTLRRHFQLLAGSSPGEGVSRA